MTAQHLTERHKADREEMARKVIALATELGAHASAADWFKRVHPRGVMIEIVGPRGLSLSVDFDGDSHLPDTHVLSWHIESDARFADRFASAWFGATINRFHFRKATYLACGFTDLLAAIRAGLSLAASGEAFDAERGAASIRKYGT